MEEKSYFKKKTFPKLKVAYVTLFLSLRMKRGAT